MIIKKRGFFENKSGLSTIVVTLILIVLALVAVGAVWLVVSGVIKIGSSESNVSGFTMNLKITRVVSEGENLSVTVQRNPGKGTLSKIKFVVSDGINSEVVTRDASIEELASQTFAFPLTQMSLTNVKSVSIAPVIDSESGESTTGQIADTFTVSGVSSGGEYYGNNNNSSGNTPSCEPSSCNGTCVNDVCVPQNCIADLVGITCGTWVCGSKINNCGQNVSCGADCSGGNVCLNGVCTTPACVPDCSNKECGLDLICSQSCGVCTGTDLCTNNICVPQNCVPESASITCGTWVCGTKTNNCGESVSCGGDCPAGSLCTDGTCTVINPLNTGLIEDVWPGSSGLYFGSTSLSTSETYENNYVKFPGSSETRCLLIVVSRLPIQGYEKSHIGFNFETSIAVGNTYQIWENLQQCNA
jgi:hypothetical protein